MRHGFPLVMSLILTAVGVGCSSDSVTGARGPDGEILTTIVSKTSAVLEDSINLTLEISNPTSNTLHLTYTLYANVYAVFSQGSAVRGDTGAYYGTSVVDTLVLQPGAKMTLPPTPVHFATPGIAEDYATGETFSLEPGNWSLKACVFGPGATSQIWVPVCGNNISFTVLQ